MGKVKRCRNEAKVNDRKRNRGSVVADTAHKQVLLKRDATVE